MSTTTEGALRTRIPAGSRRALADRALVAAREWCGSRRAALPLGGWWEG
jgi:hypothetical protein